MTDWPSALPRSSEIRRAIVSVPPPGEKATTRLIGLLG
jgi:hypothetical protein